MSNLMNAASRHGFLTVRWNNVLVIGVGVPALIYATITLSTSALTDRSAFIGLVIIGAFY